MNNTPRSVVVHDELEFYLTIVKLQKPVTIRPLNPDTGKVITLSEMECKALLVPPGATRNCCCSSEAFPPPFPFMVEEAVGEAER